MLKPLNALAAIGLLVLSACAGATTGTSATSPEVKVLDVAKADQAQVTARGTFEGKSDHITAGHAAIGRVGQQWVVILEDDFTFDGAPDPRVALGSNGYDKDTNLSLLASNNRQTGLRDPGRAQRRELRRGLDLVQEVQRAPGQSQTVTDLTTSHAPSAGPDGSADDCTDRSPRTQ